MRSRSFYIIAGEASGDLHASNLIKSIRRLDENSSFRGWGGDLMHAAGCDIVRNYKDTAIMGFLTVVKNLGKIKRNIRECCEDLIATSPDVVILVDYGGFNLKIAKFAKLHGIKVFFYISPKIWAWNTSRVKKIKRYVDEMFVIFPFEVDFYKKYGYTHAHYEGNPLVDALYDRDCKDETFAQFTTLNALDSKPIIALLAGSRSQELKYVLPQMLAMVDKFPSYQFVIAGAPSMTINDYEPYFADAERKGIIKSRPKIVFNETYRLLQQSYAALVTSGTATLETGILKVPQVVCYSGEGGAFYYFIFKTVVKVNYISLVNLIMDRESVKELLMQKLNSKNLHKELNLILNDSKRRQAMLDDYNELNVRLGSAGASDRFAALMLKLM